jgi:hypothetical protein
MAEVWARFCSLFKRKKTKEMDQVRDFIIEVGRAHMSCALVEQQLHDLLRSFGYPVATFAQASQMFCTVRIPGKATTLSGAWRPRDPVDDDRGGARA